MGKAIVVGMAVVLVLVMTLCVVALAGVVPGVLFGAVVAPLIALTVSYLVSFVFAAFGLVSERTIGKVVQVGGGAVGGFTAAQFKDWWDASVRVLQQPSVGPAVLYIGATSLLFAVVGLILGL